MENERHEQMLRAQYDVYVAQVRKEQQAGTYISPNKGGEPLSFDEWRAYEEEAAREIRQAKEAREAKDREEITRARAEAAPVPERSSEHHANIYSDEESARLREAQERLRQVVAEQDARSSAPPAATSAKGWIASLLDRLKR